jgi:hypothetical protein
MLFTQLFERLWARTVRIFVSYEPCDMIYRTARTIQRTYDLSLMTEDGGQSWYDAIVIPVARSMPAPLVSFRPRTRSGARGPESPVLVTGTRNSGRNEQLSLHCCTGFQRADSLREYVPLGVDTRRIAHRTVLIRMQSDVVE